MRKQWAAGSVEALGNAVATCSRVHTSLAQASTAHNGVLPSVLVT